MRPASARVGTLDWTIRTGGHLTPADRRSLLGPLVRGQAANLGGRASVLLRVNSGRRASLAPERLSPPSSALTRAAAEAAERVLTPALLNHSHRAYAFGAAIGHLEGVDVDRELLFAAAMLHDTGLAAVHDEIGPRSDFTRRSARLAREVAEAVGLSSLATATMRTAITMHHNPAVSPADGAEAYLLHVGAGIDVVGLRSWNLPPQLVAHVLEERPRLGFKREFTRLWKAESRAVPEGRARFLSRFGAFDLAIRLAPFAE